MSIFDMPYGEDPVYWQGKKVWVKDTREMAWICSSMQGPGQPFDDVTGLRMSIQVQPIDTTEGRYPKQKDGASSVSMSLREARSRLIRVDDMIFEAAEITDV